MAVKFPLEMKNGIQVRNISELKENFDVEKVVGYFLDGKLKKWLDARWYEDESEEISKLDESDPLLPQRLCEIFKVEYGAEKINPEEIVARNARITKLKQHTDEEDIIKNIDAVAFDQEELADLYDKGVEKIYLCEGVFKIPKSKRELKYELIGNVNVEGLETEKDEIITEIKKATAKITKSSIPQELSDTIGERIYAEGKDYVAWKINDGYDSDLFIHYYRLDQKFFNKNMRGCGQNCIGIWDKNLKTSFLMRSRGMVEKIRFVGNVLCTLEGFGFIRLYEIKKDIVECIWEKRQLDHANNAFNSVKHISESELECIFEMDNKVFKIILDIATLKEEEQEISSILDKKDLVQEVPIRGLGVCRYNLDTKSKVEFMGKNAYISKLETWYYDDELYITYYKDYRTKVICINSNGEVTEDINVEECWGGWEKLVDLYRGMYVIISTTTPCSIHFFDMSSKAMQSISIKEYCYGWLVGNYLYLRPSDKRNHWPSYRVDLDNISAGAMRISYKYE